MRKLERVSEELSALQRELQGTANRLWKLKFSLNSAYYQGCSEGDFLPRRLQSLRRQEQERFEALLHRLKALLASHLNSRALLLDSDRDLAALRHIRRTIRYLKNAYCAEPPSCTRWPASAGPSPHAPA
ncbi:MAG: hypothetical protein UZ18_ATM001000031 [Armatimonadetes bacterium OLB18]|nr:MAG: hypothetical protein UZ18_ATM001000031 [Armatimonadetes bacterium OLB18]